MQAVHDQDAESGGGGGDAPAVEAVPPLHCRAPRKGRGIQYDRVSPNDMFNGTYLKKIPA